MKNRKLLMIPGPVEFEPSVLQALGAPTSSHVAPGFLESFGNSLEMMKKVWICPSGQPFIVAGSGTLAMEMAAANLTEKGDNVLVVSTGYFGERYAELLKRFGAKTNVLKAETGKTVSEDELEEALKQKKYKLVTFTHVDTSTGVKVDPRPFGRLGKKYGVLTILDGVCSVAGEEIIQEEWGIDVVLTASQKAIGVPPGLALMVVSPKAMNVWRDRKTPVGSYYCDWNNWLPVMEAYSERKPSYFGTPPVNLIMALETSLKLILKEGLKERFARHERIGKAFRAAFRAMSVNTIPENETHSASTLSCPFFPEGVSGQEFMKAMAGSDVTVAPGLLPEMKSEYFRVGHMGSVNNADVMSTLGAIESALTMCGYRYEQGSGLKAALEVLK